MQFFKPIIDDLQTNGRVDSGTKIQILKLLKEISKFNYTKLRRPPMLPRRRFLVKLIHLKFDLKLCSFKEFSENIQLIDNCALKYIEHINDVRTYIRDRYDLKIRNFLGELDVSIEANTLKDLRNAEVALKRLADSYNYRLSKSVEPVTPTRAKNTTTILKIGIGSNLSLNNIPQMPLQSPTTSTPDDELIDLSNGDFFSKLQIKEDLLTSIDESSTEKMTSFTTLICAS